MKHTLLHIAALLAVTTGPALADTVVLKSGKKLEDVVVSRDDGDFVVINPWNSRHPDMTWEIPDKNRIPRDKVEEVIVADPPLIEYRRRASEPGLSADDHVALAAFCAEHKLKEERLRHLHLALSIDAENAAALDAFGGADRWARASHGDPVADPRLRELEREYIALEDPATLAPQLELLKEAGSTRSVTYLERARRSARQPQGLREKVPLTLRSEQAPGATYCIYVPRNYDPLVPTALVVALHGGGRGGADAAIVSGSGEQAMPFYVDQAEKWGWVIVCPTALAAPWGESKNEPWLDALIEEMKILYNVDEYRIYLTGHSMGGFGTWHWGPARADVWAAISPCAGGGGPNGVAGSGLPVYIYHGSDDGIVGAGSDRSAAKSLASGKKPHDFVYTEVDGIGHGFPAWVRADIFRFFAGRWKDDGRKRATGPASTFERKVSKEEIKTFGDPAKVPSPDEGGDTATKELIEALAKGGGGGREAADELGARGDAKTAKAVAKLLRSPKASVDTKALACAALGAMRLPECIKPLEGALGDEDFRVVEAAVAGLGATGLLDASPALARGVKTLGRLFEDTIQGNSINFREYEVRLESLAVAMDACARIADPDTLISVVEVDVAQRVYGRKEPLKVHGEDDPRFKDNPSAARLMLARRMIACLVKWADARGEQILVEAQRTWGERQRRLVQEMQEGIAEIQRARAAMTGD